MKKVLFITTRLVYPVNDGRKVVLYNYCKGLVEQHNCEVRLFSLVEGENKEIKQPDFISKVYFGSLPNKFEKIKNLIIKSIILNKWPLQVSLYYSTKSKKQLNQIIEEYKPNVVICDMARTAEYLKDLDDSKFNKILDMDDLLSKRYYRQVESNMISSNSIGAYFDKLPRGIKKIANSNIIMKKVILKEAKLLSKYEVNISKYYKSVIFVSPIEAKEFNKKINYCKSIDITIGVDYCYFSQNVVTEKKDNHIVFLGNMYVAHNVDSVNFFLNDIFPSILKQIPSCIFRIVGRCPDEYKRYLEKNKNIEVTGEVNDIRKYVQECTVAVAILKYGSGIKTKILEIMAIGTPIITNKIGKEGIDIVNNNEVILENDNSKLAGKIVELLRDYELQKRLADNGRLYVKHTHRWNDILVKFSEIL